MAHVAPTSHRRATRSSRGRRRSTRPADRAGVHQSGAHQAGSEQYGVHDLDTDDDEEFGGPIQAGHWLGLTFAFVVGLILSAMSHIGVHAAGVTLLVMLVPLTIGVFVNAFRRGFGSGKAALTTAAALAFVLFRVFL
jgi:hypothetical protein